MKKKTPFRIAAEILSNDMCVTGCCYQLRKIETKSIDEASTTELFFEKTLKPTEGEHKLYNCCGSWWMASYNLSEEENRNNRIIALLLCEQIWLDENP